MRRVKWPQPASGCPSSSKRMCIESPSAATYQPPQISHRRPAPSYSHGTAGRMRSPRLPRWQAVGQQPGLTRPPWHSHGVAPAQQHRTHSNGSSNPQAAKGLMCGACTGLATDSVVELGLLSLPTCPKQACHNYSCCTAAGRQHCCSSQRNTGPCRLTVAFTTSSSKKLSAV